MPDSVIYQVNRSRAYPLGAHRRKGKIDFFFKVCFPLNVWFPDFSKAHVSYNFTRISCSFFLFQLQRELTSFCWHLPQFLFSLLFNISAIFSCFLALGVTSCLSMRLFPASPLRAFLWIWFIVITSSPSSSQAGYRQMSRTWPKIELGGQGTEASRKRKRIMLLIFGLA